HYLLMAFVGFNIGLAFLLNKSFSVYITNRLGAIIDNTQKVPKGEQLSPPIGGSDEIAQLDKVFHDMVDELYKAQRMKQYLLSMVSHDLRSPLTSVQGLLTMMAAGTFGKLTDRAQKRVESAEAEVSRLINMTNDLLDVERLASGNLVMILAPTPAREILDAALGSMQTLAEQHQVKLFADARDIMIEADKERLIQVMINLVSNAIKSSPADSTIILTAGVQDDLVVFNVTDEGRGIPSEFIDKIFEKFQQVEESDSTEKGGKGLGLAICKSIVEAHGGTIGVVSEYGKGSTFWFSLACLK
ncbi:MAG: HAMP domain-containing histidine kinase, partial [Candidatus Obscuribacterales bacterium]|nr:HAMP domain-containing histidine kinase [Candidatus Obscuribacterales bacterium]